MIYVFNHTNYETKVLQTAAQEAAREMEVKGDVAIRFLYQANSNTFAGFAQECLPLFDFLAGRAKKKFAHFNFKGYATKDKQVGWIEVRVPRETSYIGYASNRAKSLFNTILHEMGHIWQFRNMEMTKSFQGFTGGYGYKRVKHSQRPIEIHVKKLIAQCDEEYGGKILRRKAVVGLTEMLETRTPKSTKDKNLRDYTKVKMWSLRDGSKLDICPCCGRKGVVENAGINTAYVHVAKRHTQMRFGVQDVYYTTLDSCVVDSNNEVVRKVRK